MRSVRLFFKKKGDMKFVSHLDLNRFMIRMIRKTNIPVWYSEGFNPHPYITFALPLSLGFESDYEVMDLRLDDDTFKNEDVLKEISDKMPFGIEFFEVSNPIMKAGEVAFASFDIDFGEDFNKISKSLETFLSNEHIFSEKKTKKGSIKILDLKEFIKEYKLQDNKLTILLSAGGSENLNPKLILDEFSRSINDKLPPSLITRTKLYNNQMERFA